MKSLTASLVFLVLSCTPAFCFTPDCSFSEDAYAVERTALKIAPSQWGRYPVFLLRDIQGVVQGYLSERDEDPYDCFFHPDSAGIPLNLFCDLARTGYTLTVNVRIESVQTGEPLLVFATSGPMSSPGAIVSEFANAFPDVFQGDIVRRYDYSPPTPGFRGEWLGQLYLENVPYWDASTFEADFGWSAPPELMKSFDSMRKRHQAALGIGGAASAVGLVAAGIATWKDTNQGLTERESNAFQTAFLGGAVVGAVALVWFLMPPPRGLVRRFNEWLDSTRYAGDTPLQVGVLTE